MHYYKTNNGVVATVGVVDGEEITKEEFDSIANVAEEHKLPYELRVVKRIREVYSIDDELAILRQRDTKPEEFAEYNAFVERVKAEERE